MVGRISGLTAREAKTGSERVLSFWICQRLAQRQIRSYSKGMVQRLGWPRPLLHDPDLYILDEPMSGFDPLGRALVKEIMVDLKKRGKTVFFSTHVTADVEAVCDRVGMIVSGRLQTIKTVQEVLEGGIKGYEVHVRVEMPAAVAASNWSSQGGYPGVYVPCNAISDFMAEDRAVTR